MWVKQQETFPKSTKIGGVNHSQKGGFPRWRIDETHHVPVARAKQARRWTHRCLTRVNYGNLFRYMTVNVSIYISMYTYTYTYIYMYISMHACMHACIYVIQIFFEMNGMSFTYNLQLAINGKHYGKSLKNMEHKIKWTIKF